MSRAHLKIMFLLIFDGFSRSDETTDEVNSSVIYCRGGQRSMNEKDAKNHK
jgi:hypothetical protein